MKVADNRVINFEQNRDRASGRSGKLICPAHEALNGEGEHDARGLVVALLLCLGCWVALGFFLLT